MANIFSHCEFWHVEFFVRIRNFNMCATTRVLTAVSNSLSLLSRCQSSSISALHLELPSPAIAVANAAVNNLQCIRMRIMRYAQAPPTTSWRGLCTRLAKLIFSKILPQYKGRAIGENFIPWIYCRIQYNKCKSHTQRLKEFSFVTLYQHCTLFSCKELLKKTNKLLKCIIFKNGYPQLKLLDSWTRYLSQHRD